MKNTFISSFSLPKETIKTMDLIARFAGTSRAAVLRAAVRKFIADNESGINAIRVMDEDKESLVKEVRKSG